MRRVVHTMSAAAGLAVAAAAIAVLTGGGPPASGQPDPGKAYASLPLAFVENRGQTDARVRYYAQGSRYAFYFTRAGVVLSLLKPTQGITLDLRFVGGNPRVVPTGMARTSGTVNYLTGNDQTRWRTGLRRYGQIVYRDLWPGVDLALRGRGGQLKYEFRVRPGASVADIRLAYRGAAGLALDGSGGLLVKTTLGVLRDSPPVAYQQIAGRRVPVRTGYALQHGSGYGFAVGAGYASDHELVIDPGLAYSTYLGGASDETGNSIAVDSSGNAYVTGYTQSPDFPTTVGAFRRTGSASNDLDVFVTKLNPTGTGLVYSTFLGGSNFDWGRGLVIDSAGNAYVAGQTKSSNFPTTGGAFDQTFNVDTCPRCGIDQYDAFVAKLNPSGSGLVYSTFLGGFDIDDALGIALDGSGNAYVAGQTGSLNFPTTAGAFRRTPSGSFDAFVTKLNAAGSALVYSTYLGGSDNELPGDIAVDGSGSAYVAGSTRSADYPTTPGTFDTAHNGGAFDQLFDVFLTKLNAAGSGLVYSTFLGGSSQDFGSDVAVDGTGNAYVTGATTSPAFPTTPGTFDSVFSGSEGFVAKFNTAGSALVYSTFLGEASAGSVVLDSANDAWLGGASSSATAFTSADGFDRTYNGGGADAYVAKLNQTGSALVYATFLGGSDSDVVSDLALDVGENVYVTGHTLSADFPTTAGALDRVFNGDLLIFWGDAFVAKLAVGAAPPPPPPPAASLSSLAVSPSSVVGGNTSTGTVTLTSAAPTGGAAVSLTSSNTAAASVPAGVTVTAGATSATFTITTTAVSASTAVTISAAYTGVTRTATLTVSPAGSATLPAPSLLSPAADAVFPPGRSITFDWTDVAGAASYTIQIDDTQTFTAPLTVNQTVGVSQFTTSTLPTIRMWWRARANDAAGAAGAWSAIRRFEVKN